MEGNLQTSFIPKKPLIDTKRRSSSRNIFSIIGWFVFIIALLISAGVYAYSYYLTGTITKMNADLNQKVNSFDNSSVDQLASLDSRIETAKNILNSHTIVSKLFDLIGQSTLKSVQFKSFSYTSPESGKAAVITLNGKAPDFSSVALQSDTFSKESYLKNQIFSDLALDKDGGVNFRFTGTVNSGDFKYTDYVHQLQQAGSSVDNSLVSSSTPIQ